MPEPLLIEHLDVIKQLHLGVAVAGELVNKLTLDGRKEAFHHGVDAPISQESHLAIRLRLRPRCATDGL